MKCKMNFKENMTIGAKTADPENLKPIDKNPESFLISNAINLDPHHRRSVYLLEKLQEVQEKLKEKEQQCETLTKEQLQTGEEVQELTASLFEEANKMVQEANIKRVQAEKQLEDSLTKIEILQAEVTTLKRLVLTTTPSSPNLLKIPQLVKSASTSNFIKGHKRSVSHHSTVKIIEDVDNLTLLDNEIDSNRKEKFKVWKKHPNLDRSDPFISDIIKNEINPCLSFYDKELVKSIIDGIFGNVLAIEPIIRFSNDRSHCRLSERALECTYVVKLEDRSSIQYPVSTFVRNRIAAVCNLMSYLRYITLGLVKTNDDEVFQEIVQYLLQMSAARLGLKT